MDPDPGPLYPVMLSELPVRGDLRGNLVPDGQLAAVAIETVRLSVRSTVTSRDCRP